MHASDLVLFVSNLAIKGEGIYQVPDFLSPPKLGYILSIVWEGH